MDKKMVISYLEAFDQTFDIKKSEYMVVYGATLVLRGIKDDTHDIELTIKESAFDRLVANGSIMSQPYNGNKKVLYFPLGSNFDLFRGAPGMVTIPESEVIEEIGGFQVQTLDSLINEKIVRNRPKDHQDLLIIKDFLLKKPEPEVRDEEPENNWDSVKDEVNNLDDFAFRRSVGAAIRRQRKALKLSPTELGELICAHNSYINAVERGETEITISMAWCFSKVLGISIDDMVAGYKKKGGKK